MMNADCFAFMGSVGWVGWLKALTKYLFSRSYQGEH